MARLRTSCVPEHCRLGLHHVALPSICAMQIEGRPASAIPHQLHRGHAKQAVMVRAAFGFASQKRDVFDNTAIK